MIVRNTTSPALNAAIRERFRFRRQQDARSSAAIVSARKIRIPAANSADAEDTERDNISTKNGPRPFLVCDRNVILERCVMTI